MYVISFNIVFVFIKDIRDNNQSLILISNSLIYTNIDIFTNISILAYPKH